jgi:hypothetical protein
VVPSITMAWAGTVASSMLPRPMDRAAGMATTLRKVFLFMDIPPSRRLFGADDMTNPPTVGRRVSAVMTWNAVSRSIKNIVDVLFENDALI